MTDKTPDLVKSLHYWIGQVEELEAERDRRADLEAVARLAPQMRERVAAAGAENDPVLNKWFSTVERLVAAIKEGGQTEYPAGTNVELEKARSAQKVATLQLRRLPEVVGIGIAKQEGAYVLKVNLTSEVGPGTIPTEVDGIPVTIEVVGAIRKQVPS